MFTKRYLTGENDFQMFIIAKLHILVPVWRHRCAQCFPIEATNRSRHADRSPREVRFDRQVPDGNRQIAEKVEEELELQYFINFFNIEKLRSYLVIS